MSRVKGWTLAALITVGAAACGTDGAADTKTRDVNGFSLGQTKAQVAQRIPGLSAQAFSTSDQSEHNREYRGTLDDVTYRLKFTQSGILYSLESEQPLGAVALSESFRDDLYRKVTTKYGKPDVALSSSFDIRATWNQSGSPELTMTVQHELTGESPEAAPKILSFIMSDYGIVRREAEARNNAPGRDAAARTRF